MGTLTQSRLHLFKYSVRGWWKTLLFWDRNQALYFGLALLAGIAMKDGFYHPLIFGVLQPKKIRILFFYLLVFLSLFKVVYFANDPFPNGRMMGDGYIRIDKMYRLKGRRSDVINYHATLQYFRTNGKEFYDVPCYISFDKKLEHPPGNRDYFVKGRLQPKKHSNVFYVSYYSPVDSTYSFSEMRLRWKDRARAYIKSWVDDPDTAEFFCTLATGDVEDPVLKQMFTKAGLNHTLAISGFHYTWLALVLTFFIQLFFSRYITSYLVLILVTLYFFFMGESPSLNRAWIAVSIYFIAYIVKRRNQPLNALGLGLMAALMLNPRALYHIGFQFSFAATFAILTWHSLILKVVRKVLPERPLEELQRLRWYENAMLVGAGMIKQSIALIVAVNLFIIPIALCMFKEFALWGLWYNLLFPYLITVSMVLLLVSMGLWPGIGGWVLKVCGWYTAPLIWWVYYGRGGVDGMVEMAWLRGQVAVGWLMVLVLVGFWEDDRRYRLTVIERSV